MSRPATYFEPRPSSFSPLLKDIPLVRQREAGVGVSQLFSRGAQMIARREQMLIPICLNNGYYTRERVFNLLLFASRTSKQVSVFFTDGPAKHNYLAIGKTEREARRECHRHLNRLRNHCHAALARINGDRQTNELFEVSFVDWDSIYQARAFQREYRHLLRLYQADERFREDVRQTTHEVLRKKVAPLEKLHLQQLSMNSVVEMAVHYSLEELAFLTTYGTCREFKAHELADEANEGQPKPFVYVYYQRWQVFERLVEGLYDGINRQEIGFYIID